MALAPQLNAGMKRTSFKHPCYPAKMLGNVPIKHMFKTINCFAGNEISAMSPHYAETPDVVPTILVSPIAGWDNYPKSARYLSVVHPLRQESSPTQRWVSLKTSALRKKVSAEHGSWYCWRGRHSILKRFQKHLLQEGAQSVRTYASLNPKEFKQEFETQLPYKYFFWIRT